MSKPTESPDDASIETNESDSDSSGKTKHNISVYMSVEFHSSQNTFISMLTVNWCTMQQAINPFYSI